MRKLGLLQLLLLLLPACTRDNPLLNGDDGGGPGLDGGGAECSSWHDRASCEADAHCIALGCPQCDGSQSFIGCFDKNGPLPGFGCPNSACQSCHGLDQAACAAAGELGCTAGTCCGAFISCLDPGDPPQICAADCVDPCAGLDESTCQATPACRADYCPACSPGSTYFASCDPVGSPPPTCQPLPCPPPLPCDQLTTLADCDARSDCHSVYQADLCGCADCCCTFFGRCATGGSANCTGPAFCNSAPPDCSNPACKGMFAVSYANGCYEGCVLASECGP